MWNEIILQGKNGTKHKIACHMHNSGLTRNLLNHIRGKKCAWCDMRTWCSRWCDDLVFQTMNVTTCAENRKNILVNKTGNLVYSGTFITQIWATTYWSAFEETICCFSCIFVYSCMACSRECDIYTYSGVCESVCMQWITLLTWAWSPLEMCVVGGFVRRGARSNVWRVTTFPVCLL